MPTTTEFSKAYDVHGNTIRRWCAEFAEYLSDGTNPELGETRIFTDDDATVIALIGDMRADNATYPKIHAALAAGERGQWPPISYTPPETDEQRTESAIVTRLTAELAHAHGQLKSTQDERNYLRNQLESSQNERLEAERRATSAETRAELLQQQIEELKNAEAQAQSPEELAALQTQRLEAERRATSAETRAQLLQQQIEELKVKEAATTPAEPPTPSRRRWPWNR